MSIAKLTSEKTRTLLADAGILLLRLSFGLMMLLAHGWAKLMNYSQAAAQFPDPLGVGGRVSMALAIFAEVFCSLGLVFGLLTRLALIPLIVTMSVAFFVIHHGMAYKARELALVYLVVYITLILTGPGRFSLDALLFRKRNRE